MDQATDLLIPKINNTWTIARLAMAKMGVGVMPPIIVRNELQQGLLIKLDLPIRLPNLVFTASWPASCHSWVVEKVAQLARVVVESDRWRGELA